MADYRLYLLDARGHIQRAIPLVCESDDEAMDAAARHPNAHGAELWRQERQIRTFGPTAPQKRTSDAA